MVIIMKKILINISDEEFEHLCEKKKRFGMSYTSQIQSLLRQDIEKYELQPFSPGGVRIYNQSVIVPKVREKVDKEHSQRRAINKEIQPLLERRRKMCEIIE